MTALLTTLADNTYARGPALLYVTPDDPAEVHILDSPTWGPDRLNYVERATLAARLRAVANAVDPGEFTRHQSCASGSCEAVSS